MTRPAGSTRAEGITFLGVSRRADPATAATPGPGAGRLTEGFRIGTR